MFTLKRKTLCTNPQLVSITFKKRYEERGKIQPYSILPPTEVQIPVPWGIIAGRHWNPEPSKPPILCLHGWKDNAATFDKLMPLLMPHLDNQFLCIDMPGHGRSSHYPPGINYGFTDSILWILRVINHFGWKKIDLFGHSLGAIFGFIFTSTHPNRVGKLVTIDAITPPVFSYLDLMQMIPNMTEHIIRMDEKIKEPFTTYSREEIEQIMSKSHMMGIHDEGCKILMTRGIREDPEGSGRFRFSHDIRVQYLPIMPFSHRQVSYMAKHFKNGLLHLNAEEGVNYMSTYMRANLKHWIERDNSEPVVFYDIPNSSHHLHLTHPELIADKIVSFMKM